MTNDTIEQKIENIWENRGSIDVMLFFLNEYVSQHNSRMPSTYNFTRKKFDKWCQTGKMPKR